MPLELKKNISKKKKDTKVRNPTINCSEKVSKL